MRPFRTRVSVLRNSCSETQWHVDAFRWRYLEKQVPVKYTRHVFAKLNAIPAATTWINKVPSVKTAWGNLERPVRYELDYEHFEQYEDTIVPMERTVWDPPREERQEQRGWAVKSFERFEAPFSFFLEWTKQKLAQPDTFSPNESLYIAQCSISSLPSGLRDDLPAPVYCTYRTSSEKEDSDLAADKMVRMTGVDPRPLPTTESSSIWMGIPPTETPLHKDPNHNFLVQMAGGKKVRLMRPEDGELMLAWVKRQQGQSAIGMRGEEMMIGPERDAMRDLVWRADVGEDTLVQHEPANQESEEQDTVIESEGAVVGDPVTSEGAQVNKTTEEDAKPRKQMEAARIERHAESRPSASESATEAEESDELPSLKIYQETLMPGDALFIPQSWYHSVRSVGTHADGLNVSANWWFRFARLSNTREKKEG